MIVGSAGGGARAGGGSAPGVRFGRVERSSAAVRLDLHALLRLAEEAALGAVRLVRGARLPRHLRTQLPGRHVLQCAEAAVRCGPENLPVTPFQKQ